MFTYSLFRYNRRPSFIKADLNIHWYAAYLPSISCYYLFCFTTALNNNILISFWASYIGKLLSILFVDLYSWGLRPLVDHLWKLEWQHSFYPFVFWLHTVIKLCKSLVSYLPRSVFEIMAKSCPKRWLKRRLRPDYTALGFAYRILKLRLKWCLCGLWLLNKVLYVRLFDYCFGACFIWWRLFPNRDALVAFDLCLSWFRLSWFLTYILRSIGVDYPNNIV